MNTAAQLPLHINTYSGLIATSWQLMANISAAQKKKTSDHFHPVNSQNEKRNDKYEMYIHYPRDRIQPYNHHFLSNLKFNEPMMIFEKKKKYV